MIGDGYTSSNGVTDTSVVVETVWDSRGVAVQLNLNCLC